MGMLGCATGRNMEVDSEEVVEVNLDVEVDYAWSYSTAMRDDLASMSVRMAMHQWEVLDV